jgi:heme/copper-type cytochrome/quinol oxidase subunit 3
MSGLAHESTDYSVVEREPPEILARNLNVASRLLASASIFFFFAFLFAFFYLRSLNNHGLWKPKGVGVSQGFGIAVVACVVAGALVAWWGRLDQQSGRRSQWRLKGLIALGLGLAAIVLQIVAWTQISFGPTDGAFASVYFGWSSLYALFVLLTLIWLEMCLAVSFRYRNEAFGAAAVDPGDASGDPYRSGHDIENPVALNTAEVEALAFFWAVLAGIGVVTWIVLYLL